MNWFKILNCTEFKDWLIHTGNNHKLPQGSFRFDSFNSSLRKFNNAHTWLKELNEQGTFSPTGRKPQALSDLYSSGILIRTTESFSQLGKATIDQWTNFSIPPSDDSYEIHRCILLVNIAFSEGVDQYIKYYEKWLFLRSLFEYNFLMDNKEYLYFFSFLDKDHNGFNPFNVISKIGLSQSDFSPVINWASIKSFYNTSTVNSAVDKYESTINTIISREGRSNMCTALELLSRSHDSKIALIDTLELDTSQKTKLIEIIEAIKHFKQGNNRIYYGAPGTGKSFEVNQITTPHRKQSENRVEKVTFHPEFDYHSFVGSYKPTMKEEKITYDFVGQAFSKIYVNAWKDLSHEYYLQIEEINRGNCAEIFGDIFQLLDRNPDYDVTADEDLKKYLQSKLGVKHEGIKNGKIKLPPNLHLIATMNTSDQSLFPMDSAFKRRWDWIYVPIKYIDDCTDASKDYLIKIEDTEYSWLSFLEKINRKIYDATESQDKQIGNWFVKPKTGNTIDVDTFVNKVIFYLWNDIFKEEEEHNIFKISEQKAQNFDIKTEKKIITFEKFHEKGKIYRIPILKFLFDDVLLVETI